ncbi:MAG: ATP-grasp domain-containing protein [Mesorhizobium sp.]|uniref:ATP-grasp domain-containing protein n=1 Tax=unclassified Mesorhizobium TaxID=325217 RepID=UPI000FD4F978|nr:MULTISPECIES: acetyl-CoA carboxylase biotin carboxylase subunit family protein [unclassified Mesorhizobium]RVD44691.1 ATP-grasp domain-containing protein [Mesorhizobium sp. M4A.F.Ca.ET.020.02.1.1]RWC12749.1 MAG: ATP-grasp domain-containing protein [Mesorhizobium sp.]RWC26152.1 MAG: ATP-grasp domain-containing protein [Mesorhizobium sp.]RWC52078.1 MAG: ATP-grasp domain-containing protein [Mesorhizobium sp.]RWD40710.1 MAG: ATP-grasp domain-containing protein [Mesorhizobium sp.]
MAKKRALILVEGGSNMPLHSQYVQAAQRLDLQPIALSADSARYDYSAAEGIDVARVDTENLDALIRECSRINATYDIVGITSAVELFYATAGKLSRYFDLPGPNPESIERCCDKVTQRQLLAGAGVPIPAFCVATDARDVESAAAEIGLPVIVKPAVGSGSTGVRLCRSLEELAEHTTHLLGGRHVWRSWPKVLVEEFVQGPHYCTDLMGNEIIGISALDFCRPPHFVYRELTYPAELTDDQHDRIADVSLSCLRALGLGWGPTNVELRWSKRGPVVIEVNPRLAGSPNPQLFQLAYGVDLVTEYIKLVIGDEWNLCRSHSETAAVRFLVPERDGTLDWIAGDRRAAAVPGVAEVELLVQPKMPIVRKGNCLDCIGHVFAVSPSFAQTKAILQHAVGLIDWSITPFSTREQ